MDSLSQIALGAAVSVAVMGRRTALYKAVSWGALAGTLPDLDVLIDHGDAIRNMVLHRAETHSLFWLTLFALPFGALVARLSREWAHWRRWWLAMWLVLVTHPLLDGMTVYGTQLGLPFTNYPYAVGSVFIIDPLYTLPLLAGLGWALATREKKRHSAAGLSSCVAGSVSRRGLVANALGLALSTAYLGWGVAAQQQASRVAHASLASQGIAAAQVLVTPTAFNSLLWRVVAMAPDSYLEGYYSLLDTTPQIAFERFDRGNALAAELQQNDGVQRIQAFSKGFYALSEADGKVFISDLRMGQEPTYIFTFAVAERHSAAVPLARPEQVGARPDVACGLPWLWRRMWGEPLPLPVTYCKK